MGSEIGGVGGEGEARGVVEGVDGGEGRFKGALVAR